MRMSPARMRAGRNGNICTLPCSRFHARYSASSSSRQGSSTVPLLTSQYTVSSSTASPRGASRAARHDWQTAPVPRTWLSIRVDLIEGRAERLWPRPGRVFAAARSHTFADLADAIDTAFARWDRAHLTLFELND